MGKRGQKRALEGKGMGIYRQQAMEMDEGQETPHIHISAPSAVGGELHSPSDAERREEVQPGPRRSKRIRVRPSKRAPIVRQEPAEDSDSSSEWPPLPPITLREKLNFYECQRALGCKYNPRASPLSQMAPWEYPKYADFDPRCHFFFQGPQPPWRIDMQPAGFKYSREKELEHWWSRPGDNQASSTGR